MKNATCGGPISGTTTSWECNLNRFAAYFPRNILHAYIVLYMLVVAKAALLDCCGAICFCCIARSFT